MAPVIRIDDEVIEELKKRAIALGLVFSTPNEALRAIFGLFPYLKIKGVSFLAIRSNLS